MTLSLSYASIIPVTGRKVKELDINRKEEKGIHIFSLDGRFAAHSAGDVEKELNLAISKGAPKLLLFADRTEVRLLGTFLIGLALKVVGKSLPEEECRYQG